MGHVSAMAGTRGAGPQGRKGHAGVFWKFANNAAETDDGDDTPQVRIAAAVHARIFRVQCRPGGRLHAQSLTPDTPIEQRIESAEQFFRRINARVVHQGNRAFYSPDADDTSRCRRLPRSSRHVDYYSTRAHETGHWTAHAGRCNRRTGQAVRR